MLKKCRRHAARQVPKYVQVQLELEFGRCPALRVDDDESDDAAQSGLTVEPQPSERANDVASDLEHFQFLLRTWGMLELQP
jgi:hypothetical protein